MTTQLNVVIILTVLIEICESGGIGRRARLRGVWETVWVQVPSFAPIFINLVKMFAKLLTYRLISLII